MFDVGWRCRICAVAANDRFVSQTLLPTEQALYPHYGPERGEAPARALSTAGFRILAFTQPLFRREHPLAGLVVIGRRSYGVPSYAELGGRFTREPLRTESSAWLSSIRSTDLQPRAARHEARRRALKNVNIRGIEQ